MHWYEICVRGEVPAELLTTLGVATQVEEPVETILVTEVIDVDTLHRVLGRIANLGLDVRELHRLPAARGTGRPAA